MRRRATGARGAAVVAAGLTVGAAGCASKHAATADAAPPVVDAAPDAMPCTLVAPSYADLGAVTGTALVQPVDALQPDGPKYLSLAANLDQGTPPDLLVFEFWDGQGLFNGGFAPGTYGIVDKETDLVSCSVCAYVEADYVQGAPLDFLMAASGTVVLDAIDPTPTTGHVTGSATNLKVREVTVDAGGQHTVPGGCVADLAGLQFDYTVALPGP